MKTTREKLSTLRKTPGGRVDYRKRTRELAEFIAGLGSSDQKKVATTLVHRGQDGDFAKQVMRVLPEVARWLERFDAKLDEDIQKNHKPKPDPFTDAQVALLRARAGFR